MPRPVLASLGHDELVTLEAVCDGETLRAVQEHVAAVSAAAEQSGDAQARAEMARIRDDVARAAAAMEERRNA